MKRVILKIGFWNSYNDNGYKIVPGNLKDAIKNLLEL